MCLLRIDFRVLYVVAGVIAYVVKNEKFGLGTEVAGICNPTREQIGFGFLRNVTWVARIGSLAPCGTGMSNVADKAQRRSGSERIHDCGRRIGDDQHVAFVNCLEATNARAIERHSFDKRFFFQFMQRDAKMLPGAWYVDEFKVHHLCAMFFRELQYLFWG